MILWFQLHMIFAFRFLNRASQIAGEWIARLWLVISGLTILLGFPLAGIVAAICAGIAAAKAFGGGGITLGLDSVAMT
jgi:hypothetical protein